MMATVWMSLIGVLVFVLTNALVVWIVVRLPRTYLTDDEVPSIDPTRHPMVRWGLKSLKNLAGLLVIGVGVVLSLPGVPGQGLLMILIGVMLLDFPGKRRLEHALIGRPRVLRGINWLRHRFGRPPLQAPKPRPAEP